MYSGWLKRKFRDYVRRMQANRVDLGKPKPHFYYEFMFIDAPELRQHGFGGFLDTNPLPKVFGRQGIEHKQVAYQGQFLGFPFHHHPYVFNEVVRGKKLCESVALDPLARSLSLPLSLPPTCSYSLPSCPDPRSAQGCFIRPMPALQPCCEWVIRPLTS